MQMYLIPMAAMIQSRAPPSLMSRLDCLREERPGAGAAAAPGQSNVGDTWLLTTACDHDGDMYLSRGLSVGAVYDVLWRVALPQEDRHWPRPLQPVSLRRGRGQSPLSSVQRRYYPSSRWRHIEWLWQRGREWIWPQASHGQRGHVDQCHCISSHRAPLHLHQHHLHSHQYCQQPCQFYRWHWWISSLEFHCRLKTNWSLN